MENDNTGKKLADLGVSLGKLGCGLLIAIPIIIISIVFLMMAFDGC